jgi:AmmeMemoRadiSam system protein B
MAILIREPAVAGTFYPAQPEKLRGEVRTFTAVEGAPLAALGCVVPHAGYMYSGHVAGAVYGRLQLPRRYLILCPNHTGMGHPLAIMTEGAWRTPLGEAPVDTPLATALQSAFHLLGEDADAHRAEHALEVQLPFVQERVPEFTFVPIAVGIGRYDILEALGDAIAEVLAAQEEKVLIVASSDMNHYETDSITRTKDALAIEKILALDPEGLYEVITRHHVTMCGYGPTIAMLSAAKRLGARAAQLLKYATSADISGDRSAVVGYAGIAVV